MKLENDGLSVVIAIASHADNFMWCGSKIFENEVISANKTELKVRVSSDSSFMFLGF